MVALSRRGVQGADPVVVTLLLAQERRLDALERGVWHSIAQSQRRRGRLAVDVDLPESDVTW